MYLLFDIGGTRTRMALSEDGKNISGEKIAFETPQNYAEGLKTFAKKAHELLKDTPTLKAVVGGIAASFNKEGTQIIGGGPQIKDWLQKPLKSDLEGISNAKVYIVNDTMMGGLAQSYFGPAKGYPISVYVTISTSVGGARIVDGRIDRNSLGFEPGWQIIDGGNALSKGWSEHGYLADYVGGMGILRNERKKPQDINDTLFWESRADLLAIGLYNMTVMLSPDIITLGGPMMRNIPFGRLERKYRELLNKVFPIEQPVLKMAEFGDDMGLYGALAYIQTYGV
jgi:predicted NBD/HSP70 family sugar kinase